MTGRPSPAALLATELKLHRRHGVLAGTVAMGVMWSLVLLSLPPGWRPTVAPWILFFEVSALGFFFVPALAVSERGNGVTAALRLTRLSPAVALGVRLSALSLYALAVAAVLLWIAGSAGPVAMSGVALAGVLFCLIAVLMVGRADSLTAFFARAPGIAIALLLPALLDAGGLIDSPLLLLSPATAAFEMLRGRAGVAGVVWILLWIAGLSVAAVRIGFEVRPARGGRTPGRVRPQIVTLSGNGRWAAARSFARVDARTLVTDRIALLLLAGIPLIALALRWVSGPGIDWMQTRYGVDLAPDLPAIAAFVLAIHVPVILGSMAGLLFLEDRDSGLLPAIAVAPAALRTLVVYRMAATMLATALAVAGGMWVAGVGHPAGGVGVAATAATGAAVATVPAVILAGVARDRVQGMALMKAITVPLYLPVAWWFVAGPAGWLFALAPTGWSARALWAGTAPQSAIAVVGCGVTASVLHFLMPVSVSGGLRRLPGGRR
ncbi:MAG: hypothetical protein KY393_01145 [Actinobacteria bacterium]|nr:hypothetical protein [Actinomycetota bacterium]